ncbi:hypothetical protein AVEN_5577-1, partial [Araneus ventricosus]
VINKIKIYMYGGFVDVNGPPLTPGKHYIQTQSAVGCSPIAPFPGFTTDNTLMI